AMQNGSDLTQEELEAKGANFSLIHVDFMVGGPEMEITAFEKDGSVVKLFESGNWVF
ncbi:MAG: aminopeptidase, partial [Clostridiales bacterium]|nr:aminopeptidase [Clostridiales bacterium]